MAEGGVQQYNAAVTGNAAKTLSTKSSHTRYFTKYLQTIGIDQTLKELVKMAKELKDNDAFLFLNDPKTYQDFGGYLIDVAQQLSDSTKSISTP